MKDMGYRFKVDANGDIRIKLDTPIDGTDGYYLSNSDVAAIYTANLSKVIGFVGKKAAIIEFLRFHQMESSTIDEIEKL